MTYGHGTPLGIRASAACVLAACLVMGAGAAAAGSSTRQPGNERQGNAQTLPTALEPVASSELGAVQGQFSITTRAGAPVARGGGLSTVFDPGGPAIHTASGRLTLRLASIGRGALLDAVDAGAPVASRNQVTYARGSLSEWYRNGPLGLEQGFTLQQRPRGAGRLALVIRTAGAGMPAAAGAKVVFTARDGATIASYGGLSALDARGRALPVSIGVSGRSVILRVDDRDARYPLTIDPLIQQGSKLTGGGETGAGDFGVSVALSTDGTTALIGADNDDTGKGAAWIFTRAGSTWSQQGSKLTGSGAVGAAHFGQAVALSSDGNIAVVGGNADAAGVGAAWVFTRSGTAWNQQGNKLTGGGETGAGNFGREVALDPAGDTLVVGGNSDASGVGAAWVFTRSGTTWAPQGNKLTGAGETGAGKFGSSVALSADGNTALIGGADDAGLVGAAWVFTRSGTAWSPQGAKLTGTGETGNGQFGSSVALSSDGNTALVGGPSDGATVGAAWVFTRASSTWSAQGGKLTANDEVGSGLFGSAVAVSGDGNTAVIGGPGDSASLGAGWVFTRSATTWSQQGTRFTAGDETGIGKFGAAMTLAGDGATALAGGPTDGAGGAIWVFSSALPAVSALSPNAGPATGGTLVHITGSNFSGATSVKFGSADATLFKLVSSGEIDAVAPAGSGSVNVTVTGPTGTSAAAARFTYGGQVTTPPGKPGRDKQPPSAPALLTGSYRGSVLHLAWHAATDNVRVSRYELYANGAPVKKIPAASAYATVGNLAPQGKMVLTLRAFDAAGNRGAASKAITIASVNRPRGVPATIPGWATKLFAWETHGRHGKRPKTPRKLPSWYAPWKAWQLAPFKVTN